MSSRRLFTATVCLAAAVKLTVGMILPAAWAQAKVPLLLKGEINSGLKSLSAAEIRIQLQHRHSLALRDIGGLTADLELARQTYDRQKELFDKGLTPLKDLEVAEAEKERD